MKNAKIKSISIGLASIAIAFGLIGFTQTVLAHEGADLTTNNGQFGMITENLNSEQFGEFHQKMEKLMNEYGVNCPMSNHMRGGMMD